MKTSTDDRAGKLVLMIAHCAGMVDLVALPVWIGTLVAHRRLDPQQAGGLVTLFLLGGVAACLIFAPRFNRLSGRWMATGGFLAAALAFLGVSVASDYMLMAVLHALGGFAAGTALSFTHGTIGRTANPHRMFALVGVALGVFALVFLGATPAFVAVHGGGTLFVIFAVLMLVAAIAASIAFPTAPARQECAHSARLPRVVWMGIAGISLMAVLQAMTLSFAERIGMDRGFGESSVHGVLMAIGLVNLLPAPLAALLEKRLPPLPVLLCGPLLQTIIALVVTHSTSFAPYAVATAVMTFVMIFTHTFVFGLLARLDTSGRAVAATPAMVMTGAALGPILGGTLVKAWGYPTLGYAGLAIALIAISCFAGMRTPAATVTQPA